MKNNDFIVSRAVLKLVKRAALSLVLLGFATTAYAQSAPLTPDQERAVQKLIIKTIQDQPGIILDVLKSMNSRSGFTEEGIVKRTIAFRYEGIFNNPNDEVGGNPDGDVTLVEFFDYRCGFCKLVYPFVKQLLKEDGNIKYVYKEFPILGPQSVYAARAALASRAQGKYFEYSDALMESRGTLDKSRVLLIAKDVGLDTDLLEEEIEWKEGEAENIFRNNYSLAEDLNIVGTPGFVIGDVVIRGAVDLATLKSTVAKARKKKK